jgi:hypothetical protein
MADYNINAVTRRVVYSGSAGTGPYAFSFEVLVSSDIVVYFNSTSLTLTTDYTVTINANGTGSVTIVTGTNVPTTPDANDTIIIVGARDIERTTDFVTAGDLLAASLNEQLDGLTIFDQQIAEEQKRSLMAPVYDPAHADDGGTLDMTLPAKADRLGKSLVFNATTGNPEAGPTSTDIANAQPNATAAAASAVAAAASETAAGVSETNAAASAATALAATIGKYGAHIDIAFADSPYTVGTLTEDTLITVNTSGGSVVINLPQSTGESDNRLVGINKNGATNTITTNAFAGDTVGGAASFVQYDDTEWADFYLDKSALNWQLGNLSFTAAGTGLTKTGSTISTDFASIAEVSAGTSAVKSVNPDALAGSIFGTAVVPLIPFTSATACAVGNGAGSLLFRVPSVLNGMNLVGVAAACATAGTTGTMDIQIANVTQAADMLTTKITIDSGETDSSTAATPAVIDTANDDVATGDQLRIDVDAIHTTPATGLMVELQFRLP